MRKTLHAGQLFMAGFQGTDPPLEIKNLITDHHLGGMILFTRNIEEPVQIRALADSVQAWARAADIPPLFNAVDQEGGVVARLGPPFTVFCSQGEMPEETSYHDSFRRGATMAGDLKNAGFTMNLAPVLDIRSADDGSKAALRSFSWDPHRAAELGLGVIHGLQHNGILACAKHFPGLGRAEADPHKVLPTVAGAVDRDLIPFRAAIAQRVACVMVGHALYPTLDPDRPASLSAKVVQGLLRSRMGFEGLVLSDDLEMGAVANRFSIEEAALLSFEAGCDVLLVCSRTEQVASCIETVAREAAKSVFLRTRLEESIGRILEAKKQARPAV